MIGMKDRGRIEMEAASEGERQGICQSKSGGGGSCRGRKTKGLDLRNGDRSRKKDRKLRRSGEEKGASRGVGMGS